MESEKNAPSGTPPELSRAIDQILANPQLISTVASILKGDPSSPAASSADTPQDAEQTEVSSPTTEKPSPSPDMAALMTSLTPLISGFNKKQSSPPNTKEDRQACLLRALKPYVSPGRQEAIDHMIRLTQITDLLKHMG